MAKTEPEPRWHWQDDDMSYIPYLVGDSDLMEAIYQSGGQTCDILDGKYTIHFDSRIQKKKGSDGKSRRIIRGTWYWQDSKNNWQPYPEIISDTLEGHFASGKFNTDLTDIGSSIIIVLNEDGTGKQYIKGEDDIFQKLRRGYDGKVVKKSDDYHIRQSVILDKNQVGESLSKQNHNNNNRQMENFREVNNFDHQQSNPENEKPSIHQQSSPSPSDNSQNNVKHTPSSTPSSSTSNKIQRNPPRVNFNAKSGIFKEGNAQFFYKKSWKKCYITLTKDCLCVFINMKPKMRVYWNDVRDVYGGSGDNRNGYICDVSSYFESVKLKTFSLADTEDWIDSIKAVWKKSTEKPVEVITEVKNVNNNTSSPVQTNQNSPQQNHQSYQQQPQQNQQPYQQQQNQQSYQQQPQQNQQPYQQQQNQQSYQQQPQQNQQSYQQQPQQNQQPYQQQQNQQSYQQPQQNQQPYQQQPYQQPYQQQQNQQSYQQQPFQQTQQSYQQQPFQQTQQPYQQQPFQQTQQPYQQQPYQQMQMPYQQQPFQPTQYPQQNPYYTTNYYGY